MPDADSASLGTDSYAWRQRVGLVAGPVALALILWLPAPDTLSVAGWHTAGVALLMAIWWITEALPIPATALVPVVLFPLLGIQSMSEATAPYANPLIFLFLGGFLIAIAMQRWDLHRRIALHIIAQVGSSPRALVGGFMAASAVLSMWISNTATAMMMLPIGVSIVALARSDDGASQPQTAPFAVALMLSIAYACNIGGMGTLIGTPPNALLAGFMNESYGIDIGFAQWMGIGLPIVIVGLPLTYVLLTRVLFRVDTKAIAGGTNLVQRRLDDLGAMTHPERMVAAVFTGVALLWMNRPLLEAWVPGLTDAGIAMAGGLLLFVLPADGRTGTFVLDWEAAEDLPWGVLILFGGGLSLAQAIESTGLALWIGEALGVIGSWPLLLVVVLVTAAIIGLTEITSNTATAAAFLPIMASVAVGMGENPFLLAVPVALAASSAFMLPVATPPNAIVFGSGDVSIPQMARAGIVLNLLFVVLIALVTYTLGPLVLGIELGTLPGWAG